MKRNHVSNSIFPIPHVCNMPVSFEQCELEFEKSQKTTKAPILLINCKTNKKTNENENAFFATSFELEGNRVPGRPMCPASPGGSSWPPLGTGGRGEWWRWGRASSRPWDSGGREGARSLSTWLCVCSSNICVTVTIYLVPTNMHWYGHLPTFIERSASLSLNSSSRRSCAKKSKVGGRLNFFCILTKQYYLMILLLKPLVFSLNGFPRVWPSLRKPQVLGVVINVTTKYGAAHTTQGWQMGFQNQLKPSRKLHRYSKTKNQKCKNAWSCDQMVDT